VISGGVKVHGALCSVAEIMCKITKTFFETIAKNITVHL
jgi:hypothetical protein